MADNVVKTFTVRINTETGKIAIDGLTKKFVQAETAVKKLNEEVQLTTKKGVSPLADATGLAGAAVNELGRTVSDAGYGIRGMANNISQLGSLFAILIARTGSFTNALKVMGKQFVGPLGVLFLFQAAVAALEYFSRGTKEAEDAVKDLDNTFSKQSSTLQTYLKILNNSNVPLSERQELVNKINKEHQDLNINLDEEGRLTEESTSQMLEYIEVLKQKAKAQAVINQIQENYDKLLKIENEEIGENLSFLDKLGLRFKLQQDYNYENLKEEKSLERRKEATDDLNKSNEKLIELLTEIGIIPEENNKKAKKASERRIKIFKEQELELTKEAEKLRQQGLQADIQFEEDKIQAKKFAAIEELKIKRDSFKDDQATRLANYQAQLEANKKVELSKATTEEQKNKIEARYRKANSDAIKTYNDSLLQADVEYKEALQVTNESFALQTAAFFRKQRQEDFQGYINELAISNDMMKQFEIEMATNEMDKIQAKDELREQEFKREEDRLIKQIEMDKSRNLATLEDEQKLANLRQKFNNEDAKSFEAKEKIKLSIANQVGNAIIGIAGKGSAIGKAVAVAMAIMNTKEAITNALGSKPYGPWNIAQAVAVGAFGFKQVKDILSTKLPVGAGGGGGAGATPTTVEAPDFNVVGAGTGSQLAQAVGASQSRPFRAYVVSGDVSSAQEFDRKTVNQAALG
jgi:hypothetical protein